MITVAPAGTTLSEAQRHGFEVIIEQVSPAVVNVSAAEEELACRDGHVPRRAPLRQPGAGQHVRRHVATSVL
nr:hypothetical protein [Mycobacterium lepraemurium]